MAKKMPNQFPQNAWYAVSGAPLLDWGNIMPVRLFDTERIAWRDGDGEIHVWRNQCIHRGMRLQYGFIDGNRLACRYHGWRFGPDGKCALIPAHPDMTPPEDFCVPSSPSCEVDGLIWTTIGEPAGPPPDLSEFENLTFCRSIAIDTAPETVQAAADIAQFVPFGAGHTDSACSSRRAATGVVALETSGAGSPQAVVLAIQPVDAGKTQLHVLANAQIADTDRGALRRHYAAWARQFRWHIENRRRIEAVRLPESLPAPESLPV